MKNTFPPALKLGDTIGIMAPSSYVDEADIAASKKVLEEKGFKVFIHPQTTAKFNQSAGTHAQKISALHDLVRDQNINAIFFAAGGNRALHLIDKIDFGLIAANPKIYMGFSDCTVLLNAITARTALVTYHGPVFKKLATNNQIDFNLSMLSGHEKTISLKDADFIKEGNCEGRLFGGNLATFSALIGSDDMPDIRGAILFFEDVNEQVSRLDRQILSLKRADLFNRAAGLIFGQFTNGMEGGRPFGFTLEDIIREHTTGLNIPVLMNAPFGHGNDLPAFPIGARVKLDGDKLEIL